MSIEPDSPIREVIAAYPSTRAVFSRHKLDACCGGIHTVAVAALARGLDPDRVLEEIRAACRADS